MKKLILFGICILAALASAKADGFKKFPGSNLYGLYPEFCVGNKQLVYVEDYTDDKTTFAIYDAKLDPVKEIAIGKRKYEYTIIDKMRKRVPVGATVDFTRESDIGWQGGTDLDALDEYVKSYYGCEPIAIVTDGGTRKYIFNYWYDDVNCPQEYIEYKDVDGNVTVKIVYVYYTCTDFLRVGDWEEVGAYTDYNDYSYNYLYISNLIYDFDAEAPLTQTLFNDDAEFEYVRPLISIEDYTKEYYLDEEGYKDVVYRVETYKNYPVQIGFEIVSEKGNVVKSVTFPDGLSSKGSYINGRSIIILDGIYYLSFHFDNEKDIDYTLLYEIDKSGSGLKSPVILKSHAKVSPTNLRRSQDINVTLDNPLDGKCKVMMVSSTGQTVYSSELRAGTQQLSIPTSGLAPGLYIVTVNDGDSVKENCKVIVR